MTTLSVRHTGGADPTANDVTGFQLPAEQIHRGFENNENNDCMDVGVYELFYL